jgi:hypothetical protein
VLGERPVRIAGRSLHGGGARRKKGKKEIGADRWG